MEIYTVKRLIGVVRGEEIVVAFRKKKIGKTHLGCDDSW